MRNMKREENWNHLNVKRRNEAHRAYDILQSRINYNIGESLTGAQHTVLMLLAKYRHDIHAARTTYTNIPEYKKNELRKFFSQQLPAMIRSTGLPEISIRYFPIDMAKEEGHLTAYIDELNTRIEEYLEEIDRKNGTMYCPTKNRRNNLEVVSA